MTFWTHYDQILLFIFALLMEIDLEETTDGESIMLFHATVTARQLAG